MEYFHEKKILSINIEDLEKKRPLIKEKQLNFSGVTVGVTYGFNIWLSDFIIKKYKIPAYENGVLINFNTGFYGSENIDRRLRNQIYWKEDKIKDLKLLSPQNWGIYWGGVTGDIDKIDKILFSEVYLNSKPFIHFELNPIKIQKPIILKEFNEEKGIWKKTGNVIKGKIRRLVTLYRTGFLTITYFLILTSKNRQWLNNFPHLSLKKDLSVNELIFILLNKTKFEGIEDNVKSDLNQRVNKDFIEIIRLFYDLPKITDKKLFDNLIDKTISNYFSVCIWDVNCQCEESHKNALDVIRNHPWEMYGLRGPDRSWINRRSSYIVESITDWFNPFSDIAFRPFPKVHIEISYPFNRRRKMIAMGPPSPPQRLWEMRVLEEKIIRTFNLILREENLELSKISKIEELADHVQVLTNLRRKIITILEDNYWLSNNLIHIPDRQYFNLMREITGIRQMKANLMEKLDALSEISTDLASAMEIRVGSRLSEIRTYASVISIFLATILTIAAALTNFFIWTLGPRPETLTIPEQILILLELIGINAIFLIPIVLILWRILKRSK